MTMRILTLLLLATSLHAQTAITALTSYWEMNPTDADRIAWDSKGNAHAQYLGAPGTLIPDTSIFGHGWHRSIGTQTPTDAGAMSVPGSLIDTGTGSFAYAVWTRRSSSANDFVIGRLGDESTAHKSWGVNFSFGGNNPTLNYYMTNGTSSQVADSSVAVNSGDLVLVWIAYDSATGQVKIAGNGNSWVSATPAAPFQVSPASCQRGGELFPYPCTLDFGHQFNAFFPSGAPVIGRTMFWNGYIPTDAEKTAIYNSGSGRDASYFGLSFTPPARPLTVSLVSSTFAQDTLLSTQGLYWLRPFPLKNWNPTAAAAHGDYIWVRSGDHMVSGSDCVQVGYSASPETLPASWTSGPCAASVNANEGHTGWVNAQNPHIEYSVEAGKMYLYACFVRAFTGPTYSVLEQTMVWSSTDGVTWTWEGIAFPAGTLSYAGCIINFTGYAVVRRVSAGTWIAQTLWNDSSSTCNTAGYGLWTSTDGLTWTIDRPTTGLVPRYPYRNQQNQLIFDNNSGYSSPPWTTAISRNYVGNPSSALEMAYPAWPLFQHDGTGTGGDWLQDVRSYEENGTVWVYAKWSYQQPSTVRLYRGTLPTSAGGSVLSGRISLSGRR